MWVCNVCTYIYTLHCVCTYLYVYIVMCLVHVYLYSTLCMYIFICVCVYCVYCLRFEEFLKVKWPSEKRFGLEGCEV